MGAPFASQGTLVIDTSNSFRMDPDVPLIVPQVNARSLTVRPPSGIVANPDCSTIQLVRALKPLIATFDIHQIILTTYQAASGMGLLGCKELLNGAEAVLEGSAGPLRRGFLSLSRSMSYRRSERFPAKAWLLRNASWFKNHGRSSVCLICS